MIEQLTYLVIGIMGITILDSVGSILSRKLNFNYMLLTIVTIAIYSITSISIASIGNTKDGIIAGCVLGLFDATVGALIARKFEPNIGIGNSNDFKWKIESSMVLGLVVFAGIVSAGSIYTYNTLQ